MQMLIALDDIASAYRGLFTLIQQKDSSRDSDLMFALAGASFTEFEELLVLALNGFGSGATKLLRALYERTVTTQYLMRTPTKIQQFVDYTDVHWHKLLIESETIGISHMLPKERLEELQTSFKKVEGQFTETVCKTCGRTRLQGSWTKKPIPTQASELSETLRLLCFQGYLMPTFFLHTTVWGISQLIKKSDSGLMQVNHEELETRYAYQAVVIAANLMGHFAESLNRFFKLDADSLNEKLGDAVGRLGKELLGEEAEIRSAPPQL